jgi:hypothetical protein
MAALAIAVVASGCSAGQHTGPYAVETSGRERLLTIYAYGGMTASDYQWTPQEAQFSLYGDGRVILSCARDESSPSLLPCLNETHVSPDEIQRIVAAADKAGLLTDAKFDDYLWTDDETTVFRTTVGGASHRVEAYALDPKYPSTNVGVKLARLRLLAFQASMTDLGGFLGRSVETRPYAATAFRVRCNRVDALGSVGPLRTWPLSQDPDNGGQGLTLTGDDMTGFVAAASGATVFTGWALPSGYCQLSAHPLLPDD